MEKFARLFKTSKLLRFISSVQLAIPLILLLCAVVAAGTIFESLYDSDYAKMAVYQTWWFYGLMLLLWLNIFFATLSRLPFRKHHLGFVITHIGLLTLMIGALITAEWGLDGQLRVTEGEQSATISLSDDIVGYEFSDSPKPQTIALAQRLNGFESSARSSLNEPLRHLFWIKKYIPFSAMSSTLVSDSENGVEAKSIAVSFKLKSKFFDVSEWLHSRDNPTLQLGPATLTLKIGKYHPAQSRPAHRASSRAPQATAQNTEAATLKIVDAKSNHNLFESPLDRVMQKAWTVGDVRFRIIRRYQFASVDGKKLNEGTGPELNPALELEAKKGKEVLREIAFARFPTFRLNKNGLFGLNVTFVAGNSPTETAPATISEMPAGHPQIGSQEELPAANEPPAMGSGNNVIEFWVDPSVQNEAAHLVLKKEGKVVAEEQVEAGQTYQTPWMGITVTLASVARGVKVRNVAIPAEPIKGVPLPPPAIEIQLTDGSDDFWLSAGSSQQTILMGRPAEIFYGRRTEELPFELKLQKFTKLDYPGTETPMSFESLVEIPSTGAVQLISMNEPLKKDGFTLYQSSYVLQPGKPAQSIFSVNRDPGRPVKYTGSIILALGIIIFTLMRSSWWRKRTKVAQ